MNTKQIGDHYETIATNVVKKEKYQILNTNFKTRFGEIDLICNHNNTIIFIEVRYRKNLEYGGPKESITTTKQKKIIKSAEIYLNKYNLHNQDCRFDVLCISSYQPKIKIDWIKNSFCKEY